ncbi:MAG TPA: hypothetical protein DGR79_01065 [Clostridiales bacterium]|nr:hypothetical protein [Clostridiales bacterium]
MKMIEGGGVGVLVRAYPENPDKKLMRGRPGHLRLEGVRSRTVVTRFGPVETRRRMYLDLETGSYRYLLDERLKLRPPERATGGVKSDVVCWRPGVRSGRRPVFWGCSVSAGCSRAWGAGWRLCSARRTGLSSGCSVRPGAWSRPSWPS